MIKLFCDDEKDDKMIRQAELFLFYKLHIFQQYI